MVTLEAIDPKHVNDYVDDLEEDSYEKDRVSFFEPPLEKTYRSAAVRLAAQEPRVKRIAESIARLHALMIQ